MDIAAVEARIDELDDKMLNSPTTTYAQMVERALLDVRWCTLKKRAEPDLDRWHRREAAAKKEYHSLVSSDWIANIQRWHAMRSNRKALLREMDEVLGLRDASVVEPEFGASGGADASRGAGSG